jgi:hypothetical protein
VRIARWVWLLAEWAQLRLGRLSRWAYRRQLPAHVRRDWNVLGRKGRP